MKKRILMIDDDVEFADLVRARLEATGQYEVYIENLGSRGLHAVRLHKPDLILLDVMMPDMDGSQVAQEIKNDKTIENIPLVFMTSIVKREEVESSSGVIGGRHFIAKPVRVSQIISTIEQILGK